MASQVHATAKKRSTSGETINLTVNASAAGMLDAWIDFNADGDWLDVGERIFASTPLVAGDNSLNFDMPADAVKKTLGIGFWICMAWLATISLLALLAPLPAGLRKTMTSDNGTEFARHSRLSRLAVQTFFCDPHAPWQKGGIENAIGRMRRA